VYNNNELCIEVCARTLYMGILLPRFQTTPNDPDNPIIAQYKVFYSDSTCVCLYVPSGAPEQKNKILAIFRSVGIYFFQTN